MKMYKAKSVEDYIQSCPASTQVILQELRRTIKKEVPEAEETISYSMPTYKLNGKYLIYFAGWKDHIAIYPTASNLESAIPEVAKYRTGKGTLKFPLSEPLPLNLIKKVINFRVTES